MGRKRSGTVVEAVRHRTVKIKGSGIDRGIEPIIREIWRLGIHTTNSCENAGETFGRKMKGDACVCFASFTPAKRFFRILRHVEKWDCFVTFHLAPKRNEPQLLVLIPIGWLAALTDCLDRAHLCLLPDRSPPPTTRSRTHN